MLAGGHEVLHSSPANQLMICSAICSLAGGCGSMPPIHTEHQSSRSLFHFGCKICSHRFKFSLNLIPCVGMCLPPKCEDQAKPQTLCVF
eukprot:353899-Chlamydomonas_euryale.AAC.2